MLGAMYSRAKSVRARIAGWAAIAGPIATAGSALLGCGGSVPHAEEPRVVAMEEMRITARKGPGGYEFESYDAEMLFRRGAEAVAQGDCTGGVRLYDRVANEFQASRYASPSLYNAGLCLQEKKEDAEAARRYERLLRDLPESPDRKHASFQLAAIYVRMERWEEGLAMADEILKREDLSTDERVEALSRRAQVLLGTNELEQAAAQSKNTLSYVRTRPPEDQAREFYFVAAANYVLAETIRFKAEAITVPPGRVAEQRAVLERRAQLILKAQRAYFDTIRHTDPHWAAAAGYRIGEMYDNFWHAIMNAPVPPPKRPIAEQNMPIYREEYRLELARLVKPLVRHSIRYWELTLMMVERTGVDTEWTKKIRQDLQRARKRLLEQPAGPGGLNAS